MKRGKLPADDVICRGPQPYPGGIESKEGLRLCHAYLVDDVDAALGIEAATALCGSYETPRGERPTYFPRWGEGAAGMYADQKWCEDCRIKVQVTRRRLNAEAYRLLASQRAGKGKKTKPRRPPEGKSFRNAHKAQASLWKTTTLFPSLGPDDVGVGANVDVQWRCPVNGHPTYVDQPGHVHTLLKKKKKACPLCRKGIKREAWTKPRLLALVRSLASYVDKLSAADRYQLLLQTGLLEASSEWASPIANAMLHGNSSVGGEDLLELAGGLEHSESARQLFTKLKRQTEWPRDEDKRTCAKGTVSERFTSWMECLDEDSQRQALRKLFRPREHSLLTLWRHAPLASNGEIGVFREMLRKIFPGCGLEANDIAPVLASQTELLSEVQMLVTKLHDGSFEEDSLRIRGQLRAAAEPRIELVEQLAENFATWTSQLRDANLQAICGNESPGIDGELRTLWMHLPLGPDGEVGAFRDLLMSTFPDSGLEVDGIAPILGSPRLMSVVQSLITKLHDGNGEEDSLRLRKQLLAANESHIELIRQLAENFAQSRLRDANLQAICGNESPEIAKELWRVAPQVGTGHGLDAFRMALKKAIPEIEFDEDDIQPASTISETFKQWQRRVNSEVAQGSGEAVALGEPAIDSPSSLPSDRVEEILDVSDKMLIADDDQEAVEYFVASQVSKIWRSAFDDFDGAVTAVREWGGNDFGNTVRDEFLREASAVEELELPDDWEFRPDGVPKSHPPYPPRTMQRLTAVRLMEEHRGVGNWSLMGGGKTVSAILSAAILESKLTLIVCPNATVGGWLGEITRVFPLAEVSTEWSPPPSGRRRFIVLNIEQFQLPDSASRIGQLLSREFPQLVVLDEVHQFKRRDKKLTKRREMLLALLTSTLEAEPDLKILAMTGTPVINNLTEAKSLIELCSMVRHEDLDDKPTLPNAMRVHARLARLGIRYRPDYLAEFSGIERFRIDVSHRREELANVESRHDADAILMEEKLQVIANASQAKTVIYSELVTGIHHQIGVLLRARGLSVGFFNGPDKSGLEPFKNGDIDCLVASNSIGTGVDGLQYATDKLIIATLPWTSSGFDQLLGRFFRPRSDGSIGQVSVLVPWTYIPHEGNDSEPEWSLDAARWRRIQYKASLADTAVDGVLPQGELRTSEQAFGDAQAWLQRMKGPEQRVTERQEIRVPLPQEIQEQVRRRVGDLTKFHARLASSNSETTHAAIRHDPQQWAWYHTEVQRVAEDWPFRPVNRCIEWIGKRATRRKDLSVVDLGCGLAELHQALDGVCDVRSFDHIAGHDFVEIANIAEAVPMPDESADIVVLSLSIDWQKDWMGCLDEAARLLRLDGQLLLWETPTFVERSGGMDALVEVLQQRSLQVLRRFEERFVGIVAVKT